MKQKNVKRRGPRLLSVLLSLCLVLSLLPVTSLAAEDSGTCGDNLTWILDADGTLTISGTGNMYGYDEPEEVPWYQYRMGIKTVIIENGVTSIGNYAFYVFINLVSVTISGSVSSIGRSAFYGCSILTSVTIPDGVTSIGEDTFFGCSDLNSLSIPDSVTAVGDYAFWGCDNLTNVYYGGGEEDWNDISIGTGNALMTDAAIHYNTTAGGTCGDNLTWTLDADGTLTISGTGDMDNYDYSSNPDGSITYTAPWYEQRNNIKAVVIENGVTSIGSCTFPECNGLTDMTIPGSVTTIGDYAFWSCVNLTSVTFSQTLTGIGEWVFASCTDLTSVILDDSVSSIGEGAFSNCGALTDVYYAGSESQWEQIDIDNSNGYNNSLLNATIHYNYEPTSGTCGDNLTWTLDADGTLTISGTGDMYGYGTFVDDTHAPWYEQRDEITAIVIESGVTSIGESAFENCSLLSSVSIPDSVTAIEDSAFFLCVSLTSVTIPAGITDIEPNVFGSCESLSSVSIPDSVTFIGDSAFRGTSLTSVTIPDNVTFIGDSVFHNCASLTSVTIPKSVDSIGDFAFYNCDSLTDVYYGGSESQWEQIEIGDNNDPLTGATIHFSDTDTGTSDDVYFFTGDTYGVEEHSDSTCSVTYLVYVPGDKEVYELTLDYNSREDAHDALEDARNFEGDFFTIKHNDMYEFVRVTYKYDAGGNENPNPSKIDGSFYQNNVVAAALDETTITAANGVEYSYSANDYVFIDLRTDLDDPDEAYPSMNAVRRACENGELGLVTFAVVFGDSASNQISTIYLVDSSSEMASGTCGDNLTWILYTNGTLVISGTGDMHDFYDDYAPWYEYNDDITSVVIENGVTSIGARAFLHCYSLASAVIGNSVTTIGEDSFNHCESLTSVDIPSSATRIERSAFFDCASLASVTFPDGLTYIGDSAFLSSGLTSVTIPDSVTSLAQTAFSGCRSLKSVVIGDGVKTIGSGAFMSCTSLTDLVIGSSVTLIDQAAFTECSSLTSVPIPVSVREILANAFERCESLTDVYYGGTESQWEQIYIGAANEPLTGATIHFAGGSNDGEVLSGKCGDNLTWTLTPDGTLTISGTGDMTNFGYKEAPWYEQRNNIKAVVIENGVTSIGNESFADCTNLTSVTIPDGIASIRPYAFGNCTSLTNVTIPASVTYIGSSTFGNCSNLNSINVASGNLTYISVDGVLFDSAKTRLHAYPGGKGTSHYNIPDSVTTIGQDAFYHCTDLTSVTIPASVTVIEYEAFYFCVNLTDVYYNSTMSQWEQIEIDNTLHVNGQLLCATIHCIDGDIGGPAALPDAVKYVPYSSTLEFSEPDAQRYQLYSYEVNDLPDWLEVDSETDEIYGVPMSSETYVFSVMCVWKVIDGVSVLPLNVRFSVTVLDNSNSNVNVQLPNDYDIIENVGSEDPKDPNNYLLTEYRSEEFVIDGPYVEFYRLLIDGVERTRDVDYTVREGSTVITIKEQTFRSVGEGTHTIAAEFRQIDSNGKQTVKQVAQNYTLTIKRPNSSGGGGAGGSGGGGGGGAGAGSTGYSVATPDIPNCTVTVSPASASAGTVVTLTVQPDAGYELASLTVTGPNGERLTLTQIGDNQYTFQMPGGNVDISAQVQEAQPGGLSGSTPFVDMLETDWFYQAVVTAYERGWMVGTSANTFSPYATTSRGMFVTVLHRIAGEPSAENSSYFSDVPLDQYYAPAAAWAAEQRIVAGYGDGRFGSTDDLTREQIVIILHNYASLTGMDTTKRNELSQFTDLAQLSAGAQEAMSWANAVGLISGKGDGILDPAGSATRAEMAALLVRFAALAQKQEENL